MDSEREFEVGDARLFLMGIKENGSIDGVDLELVDGAGERWSASVFTLAEIERIMHRNRSTGDDFSGSMFRIADLFIIDDPTVEKLLGIISELVRTGDYRYELTPLGAEE